MLQATLGVASDLLKLVGSNLNVTQLADNVNQELNADCDSELVIMTADTGGIELTLFAQVVGLLVHNTRGPPFRLGLLGVASSTGSRSWRRLATVVRVSNLFARLNELDKGFRNHATVKLLEVLEGTFIVVLHFSRVSDAERDHFIRSIR